MTAICQSCGRLLALLNVDIRSSLLKTRVHLPCSPLPSARDASTCAEFTRAVPSSLPSPSTAPHSSRTPLQEHATPISLRPQAAAAATALPRPYSEIPKTKTVLGLNFDMLMDPHNAVNYMERQTRRLGHIFRLTGTPGVGEMVCVVEPQDVETVYRLGDAHYPERYPFLEWRQARNERNRSKGLFLE